MKGNPYSLEILDEAEKDFDNAFEYYNNESFKVADKFFQCINVSMEIIKKSPFSYEETFMSIRKFTVKKFPFVIYYQIVDTTIRIIAIFHTSRNPKIWTERVE